MDWTKFLSREFIAVMFLLVSATAALFWMPKHVGFVVWAGACGGFLSVLVGGIVTTKIKAKK